MKINANFRLFASTNFDASKYLASPAMGVNRFMLDRIGEEKARCTTIVEYQPNSKFPEHVHIGGEEFLVLAGTFKDQFGEFPAGTYVRNPIGSKHAPWVDEDGCTIMVKLLQMADLSEKEGTQSLHVNLNQARQPAQECDYGQKALLYQNDETGERVDMCWLNANHVFTEENNVGGEELFVIDGSLEMGKDEDNDVVHYSKWGWLRFPVQGDERRSLLKAGKDGAQVWRKTGHLTEKALSMEKIKINPEDETVIV